MPDATTYNVKKSPNPQHYHEGKAMKNKEKLSLYVLELKVSP